MILSHATEGCCTVFVSVTTPTSVLGFFLYLVPILWKKGAQKKEMGAGKGNVLGIRFVIFK